MRAKPRAVRSSRLMLVGAVVVSAVILGAWFPAHALLQQHTSLASANAQLTHLHQQDAALAQERKNLSNADEIARIAREQYQLVSPGQQAYEVLPPSGAATPGAPYAGDPGTKAPVDPSGSAELPPGAVTTTTVPAAPGATKSSTATHSEGALDRMLHALEFWR
ncbi:MAG TPA: septum formation initiator family protein [Acidimicrobiales bacterium]|nr:septum formation initiator family protein [Acidimicrobiales bacterium]